MEKGYEVIRNAFDKFTLAMIKRDFEKLALTCKAEDVFRTKDGDVKQIQNMHLMGDFGFNAVAGWIIKDLGYKGEVLNMQYFIKHPEYKITAPHQDGAYFNNTEDDILTFWIPLHDVTTDTSTMFYVDWDGKREIIPHENCGSNIRTRTGNTGVSQYTSEYPLEAFTPIELKYGDCVVHNQFAVHYSNENSTDKPRIAITCILKLKKKTNGEIIHN